MHRFTLAEARSQLGRLVAMVEAGEDVAIAKRGQAVVRLVRINEESQKLPSLAGLRGQLPEQTESAGEFVRGLRESAYWSSHD